MWCAINDFHRWNSAWHKLASNLPANETTCFLCLLFWLCGWAYIFFYFFIFSLNMLKWWKRQMDTQMAEWKNTKKTKTLYFWAIVFYLFSFQLVSIFFLFKCFFTILQEWVSVCVWGRFCGQNCVAIVIVWMFNCKQNEHVYQLKENVTLCSWNKLMFVYCHLYASYMNECTIFHQFKCVLPQTNTLYLAACVCEGQN